MQSSSILPQEAHASVERRDYQRVEVDLLGRFMLENRSEYPCRIGNMSPGDIAVVSPIVPARDERVILYLDHIGRLEGRIRRLFSGGFAATITASDRKREKLAAQLTWLANRHELDLPEDRRHERIVPASNVVEVSLPDGRRFTARLIDLSLSGAAIQSDIRPAVGARITVGSIPARVVRLLELGFAVEFASLQNGDSISAQLS